MKRLRFPFIALLCVTCTWLVLADGPSDSLPPADMTRLINAEIKFIQEALVKGKADVKTTNRVKLSALMIAHYAQTNMTKDNAKEMATLRDRALKVIKAMDDPAAAKKLAADLSAKPAADPAAKTDKISLTPHLEVGLVMRAFSSKLIGGFSIEKDLDELSAMKGPVPAADQERIGDFARKLMMIGTLAHDHYAPNDANGKKWQMLAKTFRDASHGMIESVTSGRDIGVAANNVMLTCIKCHEAFRKH